MKNGLNKFLIALLVFITGCSNAGVIESNNNSSNKFILETDYENSSYNTFIKDDQSETIATPINSYSYDSYEHLYLFIPNNNQQNNHYWILNPLYVNPIIHQTFELWFDDIKNNEIKNLRIYESYCIYDEKLGTLSDESLDVPYYSMQIDCLFYSFKNEPKNSKIILQHISDSKIKITIESDNYVVGYLYVYHGNLDVEDYIIDYINKNLLLI